MSERIVLTERWNEIDEVCVLIKKIKGFQNSKGDFRGVPLGDSNIRNNIDEQSFRNCDFSFASFENCNLTNVKFDNCIFNRASLKYIRLWDCSFVNCTFKQTDFKSAALGYKCTYEHCTFVNSKLNGKDFDFGNQTKYLNCKFLDCQIGSTWILSVKFRDCTFNSQFKNVRFSGSLEVKLRKKKEFPASFINCNLENSRFINLEIMEGVIFENSSLPKQDFTRTSIGSKYYE